MKESQKGSAVPVLITIIAILVIGGGIYFYAHNNDNGAKEQVAPTTPPDSGAAMPTPQPTASSTSATLDLSSAYAQQYRTVLANALTQSANFNEHYVIASIGCGTGCFTYVAVDKRNGKVYPAPLPNDLGQFNGDIELGEANSIHSNLLKVIVDNGSKINTYSFDGTGFTLVSSEKISQ